MGRILVVHPDAAVRRLLRRYGEAEGHSIEEAGTPESAAGLCRERLYDLFVVGVSQQSAGGFAALEKIRAFSQIPAIALADRDGEAAALRAFRLGADDFVAKPFSPRVFMMRVRALLRRAGGGEEGVSAGGLKIRFDDRRVEIGGRTVALTPRECALLLCLVKHRGSTLPRSTLMAEVWGAGYSGGGRTLDTHIKRLRRLLGPYGERIATVRGLGYRFETAETKSAPVEYPPGGVRFERKNRPAGA